MQTSYWSTWGGGPGSAKSSMAFFKGLVDGLNHREYPIQNYEPNYFEPTIVEIIRVHNLVLIRKGENNEKSNDPESIQRESEAGRSS